MELVDLPVEILLVVADHLPRLRDLASLSQISRHVHAVLNEHIYRRGARNNLVSALAYIIRRKKPESSVAHLLKWAPNPPPEESQDQLLQETVRGSMLEVTGLFLAHWGTPSLGRQVRHEYLVSAVLSQDKPMVLLLPQHGFDINMNNGHGTPLIMAIYQGSEEMVKLLLDHGADPQLYARNTISLLDIAVCRTRRLNVKVVELLIRRGADANGRTWDGATVLHQIARLCEHPQRTQMAEILLRNGADVRIKDPLGRTPLSAARTSGNKALQRILWARS